ncbi:MAG: hypothetical protein WB930_14380 [Syntrophobacteraceae bacterium]
MNQLAKKETSAASADDLKVMAEQLREFVRSGGENEGVLIEITNFLNREPSLIARFFGSPLEREREKIAVAELKAIYKQREKFFEFYGNIRLEIARKHANGLITMMGMDLQKQLTAFAKEQIEQLQATIQSSRQSFMERMAPQLASLDKYANFPRLHEAARISMDNEMDFYFRMIDTLYDGFEDSLRTQIPRQV